ncbi:hypothetical protein [Terriglobus sp. ADX1]|uniref:hypothetical protein n=1 Tax=Terriglobus sp. ADX1 TaxID=2794063 RepID=UPI002FE671C9
MTYEVRVTIHQKSSLYKPDYGDITRRLEGKGFSHLTMIGGQAFHTLGGMYRLNSQLLTTVASVAALVDSALRGIEFEISYQVIKVESEKDYNLKPVSDAYGYALSAIYKDTPFGSTKK